VLLAFLPRKTRGKKKRNAEGKLTAENVSVNKGQPVRSPTKSKKRKKGKGTTGNLRR